jgi:uncharacterized protein
MIVLLSPAKTLDLEMEAKISEYSQPLFLSESESLVNKLKRLSGKQLGNLMNISPVLADLNHQRYQEWSLPFTETNAKRAALCFQGEAYRGWNAAAMNDDDLAFSQKHVRILSGLYGILRPLDLIQPYRLEMGSKFEVSPKVKNLYAFWKEKLTEQLVAELNGDVLLNLASTEYSKAIDLKAIQGKVITPVFKDLKNGQLKVIMTYAKKARGLMTRYVIRNRLANVDEIKLFDLEGYSFNVNESTDSHWVFSRN